MGKTKRRFTLPEAYPAAERRTVPPHILDEALSLYRSGRYVDAFHAARRAGPLQSWQGGAALAFGFRLAANTGNSRLAALLITRGLREEPDHPEVAVHGAYHLSSARGHLAGWRHALRCEAIEGMPAHNLAELKAHRASVAATYRDFDTAWNLWKQASELNPESPWMQVEKASILHLQDRMAEALAATEEALEIRPWYRPAVQMKATLLHLEGRWREAVEFLTESLQTLQSYGVALQLLTLKREADDHEGMDFEIARAKALSISGGAAEAEWLKSWSADTLYLRGDYERAAEIASQLPGDFYPSFAERLRQPGARGIRKRLPFQFVRQTHMTCAPATLAAIAHFWQRPITMEQIADAICYDGTYDYSERSWCEANGYSVREFTVTLEAARTLIDADVPFVVSTIGVSSGHAQAIIGYDDLRQTLFIQDPSLPHYREVAAADFLEEYQLNGPRGLVFVPEDRDAWLAALSLPDAELYNINHRFSHLLAAYDRAGAEAALLELEANAPDHRLTLLARMSLTNFDGNEPARAACIDRLLERFPDNPRLIRWKYTALRTLGKRDGRLALLRPVCRENPVLLRDFAEELMADARDWRHAKRLLWQAHAAAPSDTAVLVTLADLSSRQQSESVENLLTYYRLAAAYSDKVEGYSQLWFQFAVSRGRTEEALAWLRRRMREYGAKSSEPAVTLAQALDALLRPEVVEVIREAVELRPNDGGLLLQCCRMERRLGNLEAAAEFLQRANGKCNPGDWARAHAALLRRQGDHEAEQKVWQKILLTEPLAQDAHNFMAETLAARQGRAAAAAHLMAVRAQFPHHYSLAQLLIRWLRGHDDERAADEARAMMEMHPSDPWAYRELALILSGMGRPEDALVGAEAAIVIAPHQPASHSVKATVLAELDRQPEAAECFRVAIRLDVNHACAYEGLLKSGSNSDFRRSELAFIRQEMIRQVLDGTGLHAYRAFAFTVLSPDELLAELREIWQARPDLWESWSVLIGQLTDMDRSEEALTLAAEAAEKFALIPGAWLDLARVKSLRGDLRTAAAHARRATELNPDWSDGWRHYARYVSNDGRTLEAIETLRRASVRLPLDPALRGDLAPLLWNSGQREEAWAVTLQILQDHPGRESSWASLQTWAGPMEKQAELLAFARSLCEQRPHDAKLWYVLARLLPRGSVTEVLEIVEKAIALEPRNEDLYDFRADILGSAGKVAEAEDSLCKGPWSSSALPLTLRGRLAWLKAMRGDVDGALQSIKQVLSGNSDYIWGWKMQAAWAEQSKNLSAWREAAAALMRLQPQSADCCCTAADAEFAAGNTTTALEYLERALRVDRGNQYAAYRLLNHFWEKRSPDELTAAAEKVDAEGPTGLIHRVFLMLAASHRQDVDGVKSGLASLATQPDLPGPLSDLIENHFHISGRMRSCYDEALDAAARENAIGPAFAILWVKREIVRQRWHCWLQLVQWWPALGTRLQPAVIVFLDGIGERSTHNPHLNKFLQSAEKQLRASTILWAKAGYALAACSDFRGCIDWMKGDYQRPDVEGWMLSNLAISYRLTNNAQAAGEVSLYAVERQLRDDSWSVHVVTAAYYLAIKGRHREALDLLNRESLDDPEPNARLLILSTRALCEVMPRSPMEGRTAFRNFVTTARRLISRTAISRSTYRAYMEAVDLMKNHTGAKLMPWERPNERYARRESQPRRMPANLTWIFFAVFILARLIPQSCSDPSSFNRYQSGGYPSSTEIEKLLNDKRLQSSVPPTSRPQGKVAGGHQSQEDPLERARQQSLQNDLSLDSRPALPPERSATPFVSPIPHRAPCFLRPRLGLALLFPPLKPWNRYR